MTESIKVLKRQFWSRPGAAAAYDNAVSSDAGSAPISNMVEIAMVSRHARGAILDAGSGTGRFAIPLAVSRANSVVALDYSAEMLTLNRSLAARRGIDGIRYVRGDVEHLPFASDHFDAVVSITVVRHFPEWRAVLQEYIRVVKPGGTLVFEMCSGDHVRLANRIHNRFGVAHSKDGFLSYEAEVPFAELRDWLDAHGIGIVERRTYDFLNSNLLLQAATLTSAGYARAEAVIGRSLKWAILRQLIAWAELRLLYRLPPMLSSNYLVVGRKR